MPHEQDPVMARLARLERQVRAMKLVAASAIVVGTVVALMPGPQAQQATDTVRVRQLIVEDADGRSRIVLGYLDQPGNTRRFGMRINDPQGAERLGLSLMRDNSDMVIGLDAPPGTGDDRNKERINLVADGKGGAHIRFLDRRTSVASRMYLDEQNRVWLSFSDFMQTPASIRRYGLSGEEIIRPNP